MSGVIFIVYMLVGLFFALILFSLWLRLFLRCFGAPPQQIIYKTIVEWTDKLLPPALPLLGKLRRGRIEWTVVLSILFVDICRLYIITFILLGGLLRTKIAIIHLIGDLFIQPLRFLLYAMILRLVMGLFKSLQKNPLREVVFQVTEPFIQYSRDLIPIVSGYDFSPFLWMMIFKGVSFFIFISIPILSV